VIISLGISKRLYSNQYPDDESEMTKPAALLHNSNLNRSTYCEVANAIPKDTSWSRDCAEEGAEEVSLSRSLVPKVQLRRYRSGLYSPGIYLIRDLLKMKFTDHEERQLESWSRSELDAIGQKNPEVVARLIVSLVKEDRSAKALQAHCNKELMPFLKETTQDFVEVLFQAIEGSRLTIVLYLSITVTDSFFRLSEGTYRVDIDDGNNDDEVSTCASKLTRSAVANLVSSVDVGL
jgi:hypothetical protein